MMTHGASRLQCFAQLQVHVRRDQTRVQQLAARQDRLQPPQPLAVRGWTPDAWPTGRARWARLQHESLLFAIRLASHSHLGGQEVSTPRTLGLRWLGL